VDPRPRPESAREHRLVEVLLREAGPEEEHIAGSLAETRLRGAQRRRVLPRRDIPRPRDGLGAHVLSDPRLNAGTYAALAPHQRFAALAAFCRATGALFDKALDTTEGATTFTLEDIAEEMVLKRARFRCERDAAREAVSILVKERDEQRKPLYSIVDATFPMLLQLAQRVLAHPLSPAPVNVLLPLAGSGNQLRPSKL
jgi:hypothetical protein